MQFILKIVRSKGFDALMAALFGALIGAIVAGILFVLYRVIVVEALSVVTPEWVGSVVLPAIGLLLILGHAAVGFGSGLGMFRRSSLGRFLYYGSSTSVVRGLFGQIGFHAFRHEPVQSFSFGKGRGNYIFERAKPRFWSHCRGIGVRVGIRGTHGLAVVDWRSQHTAATWPTSRQAGVVPLFYT